MIIDHRTACQLLGCIVLGCTVGAKIDDKATPDTLLLKDFRPNSIYNIPKTHVTRARFPVLDVHSHVYAKTPARVDEWVRVMDQVGIQKTVVTPAHNGTPEASSR